MTLKAGTVEAFEDSMAAAIEQAFEEEWNARKPRGLPEKDQEDRRILFTAIARGVTRHLAEHAGEAFRIDVEVTQVTGADGPLMDSSNATVSVTQDDRPGNRIESRGTAVVREVDTE